MKTRLPMIVTAGMAREDAEPFNRLRQQHFPAHRNFLQAHLTMFHRLPGELMDEIHGHLTSVVQERSEFSVEIIGLRHLGAGVAYQVGSTALQAIREELKTAFRPWLGPQDLQTWQPHITIQNRVEKQVADDLYRELQAGFRPSRMRMTGLELWKYLDGPWEAKAFMPFTQESESSSSPIRDHAACQNSSGKGLPERS